MNWSYISGFLDADGSVSYYCPNKGKKKCACVTFHNNEKVIVNKIRKFIEEELGIKGSLSTKRPKLDSHNTSYDLKYNYQQAIEILKRIDLMHPKKRHRKNILIKIQKTKPRNGKYNSKILAKIAELESQYI
jgi:hypothetical protein